MTQELILAASTGTITSPIQAGGNALSDSTKQWADSIFRNFLIMVTGPTGQCEFAVVDDNGKSTLLIRGTWQSSYPIGSAYEILGLGDLRQALRDVFGGGGDINTANPLQVYDPKVFGSLSGLIQYGVVTAVPGANQFTIPTLAGQGAGKFSDATDPFWAFVYRKGDGSAGAPQGEQQQITAYDSATGTFTTNAFTVAVAANDEILIVNPDLVNAPAIADLDVPAKNSANNAFERDVIGNKTDTVAGNSLYSLMLQLLASGLHGFVEQPAVAVGINAVNTGETNVFNLAAANTRYLVRSLRLKCADPGANTVTVYLYELVNGVLTQVDSFVIGTAGAVNPFTNYYSLNDMFGKETLAGDQLKVTVVASAGGPYAITGEYSWASTT